MNADEIIKLIDNIPRYVCYIYPGYISMYLYYYFHSLTLDETKAKIVKSVAISYFYIILLIRLFKIINDCEYIPFEVENGIEGVGFNIWLVIFSIAIPYVLYRVQKQKNFIDKFKRKLLIDTSLAKNEIEVLQKKYKDTIWIYVYMKNSNIMYEGSLTEKELEAGRTRFFCLSKYRKYLMQENGEKKKLFDYSNDEKEKVLIYFDMISHFEIANIDKEE